MNHHQKPPQYHIKASPGDNWELYIQMNWGMKFQKFCAVVVQCDKLTTVLGIIKCEMV